MNIIIDTSILRKARNLSSSDMLLLKKLSKLELIKLHFPWLIFKESTSQNHLDISTVIKKVINEISSLDKKGLGKEEHNELLKVANELEKINEKTRLSVDKHWEDFIADSKAILHDFDVSHGKKVMISYFNGDKPFPNPKSRKDIPDAFIFEAISSIKETFNHIVFICDDNNLRDSLKLHSDIITFDSFSKFYDYSGFKLIENEYKKIEHYADELIILTENVSIIKAKAEDDVYGDLLAGENQVISSKKIPSDGNDGALIDIENIKDISIENNKIKYVDEKFYIPIQVEAKFKLEYFLYKSDYFIYSNDRKIEIVEPDWNDPFYLVEESFNAIVLFNYSIEKESIRNSDFEFKIEALTSIELHPIEINKN